LYNGPEVNVMVFQSNLHYEKGTSELKELGNGVYVIETNVKPVYSYFRPDPKGETVESERQPAKYSQAADSNK
jgi:hypothetical protein